MALGLQLAAARMILGTVLARVTSDPDSIERTVTLLKQIHAWSLGLHPCLRDALRRLLDSSSPTETDYDDLYAILKMGAGIADPSNRVPQPLQLSHLPSEAATGSALRLLSVRRLKNVNRIAPEQLLEFEPEGLTVIYGDNGTGKSGYSRVLKLACRARGEKSTVLPNAHLPPAQQGVPEAEFLVEVNGAKSKYQWRLGAAPQPEFSLLSVFDTHCARAYVDSEQDVAYLPYGLDVVENLANVVLPELNRRLKAEIAACIVDKSQFQELIGNTAVGAIIASLSGSTDKSRIDKLASMSEDETARYSLLSTILNEQDPAKKAGALRRVSDRLKKLKQRIDDSIRVVNSQAFKDLKDLIESTRSAIAAESLAAEIFRSGEDLLPGTGGPEWQQLFNAARGFARLAYPNVDFPAAGQDSLCVLCQQPVPDAANSRLRRFDAFIKDNAAQLARAKTRQLDQVLLTLSHAAVAFEIDTALQEEMTQFKQGLCASLLELQVVVESRLAWMQQAAKSHDWSNEPCFGSDPRPELLSLIQEIGLQAEANESASNESMRQQMKAEFAELEARVKLSQRKESVLTAIDKLSLVQRLKSCAEHIRPLPISNKSKEFAYAAVTQGLIDALNKEFEAFNIVHLKTKVKTSVTAGKTYHKLVLDLPSNHKLTDILSEGELRVMAIASFLAELSVSGHLGGAIFDDPVSSLDYFRRISVAHRLVAESKVRQVVIFTHDALFLAELRSCIEQQSLPAKFFHLEWTSADYSGYCCAGLPWLHQGFDDRIDSLEKEFRSLRDSWTPIPSALLCDRMRTAFSHLRATIERAIEQVFLNGVVKRFENYIPVARMSGIKPMEPAEVIELNRLFKVASDVTNAHDTASSYHHPIPDPCALNTEIQALRKLVSAFRAR
jgi:hypothetical protein